MKSSDERGVSSGRKKAQFHSVSGRMCLLLVYFEEVCKVSLSSKKEGVCSCNAPPWGTEQHSSCPPTSETLFHFPFACFLTFRNNNEGSSNQSKKVKIKEELSLQ